MSRAFKERRSSVPIIIVVIVVIVLGSVLHVFAPKADAAPPSLEAFCNEMGPNAAETYGCP